MFELGELQLLGVWRSEFILHAKGERSGNGKSSDERVVCGGTREDEAVDGCGRVHEEVRPEKKPQWWSGWDLRQTAPFYPHWSAKEI